MKREIRDRRYKYFKNSIKLKTIKFSDNLKNDGDEISKLIQEQDVNFKKYVFFDRIIKATEKLERIQQLQ